MKRDKIGKHQLKIFALLGNISLISLLLIQPPVSHPQGSAQSIEDYVIGTELNTTFVKKLRADGFGMIWFGSCGSQHQPAFLVKFDTVTRTFEKFGFTNTEFSPFEQCVEDVAIDSLNKVIWFTLLSGDLGRRDLTTGATTFYRFSQGPLPGQQNNLANVDQTSTLALAPNGILWMGIHRVQLGVTNIVKFDPSNGTFVDKVTSPDGASSLVLNGVDLWFTGFDNIRRFDTFTETLAAAFPIPNHHPTDLIIDPFDNTNIWFGERKDQCKPEPDPDSVKFTSFVGRLNTLTGAITHFKVFEAFESDCSTLGVTVDIDGNVWSNASLEGGVKKVIKLDPFSGTATVLDTPSGPRFLEKFGGSIYYYGTGSVHTGKIPLKSTVILKSEMLGGDEFMGAPINVDRSVVHTLSVLDFRKHSVHTFTASDIPSKTFVGWFDQNGNPIVGIGNTQDLSLQFKADDDAYIIAVYS